MRTVIYPTDAAIARVRAAGTARDVYAACRYAAYGRVADIERLADRLETAARPVLRSVA